MIDICDFLNSRDIADYLCTIGYEFTMPEAAFLIYQSTHKTLDEKIAAWQCITEEMPD